MKKILLLLVSCVLSVCTFAQVQSFPAGNLPEKGVKGAVSHVNYALPTTTLKVTVSVSKVQDVRGYFADYAESLLGLTNIIHQSYTGYTLNSVDIEPIRTADLSQQFVAFTSNADVAKSWREAQVATTTNAFSDIPLTSYTIREASLPDFFKNYADISYIQQSESFVDTKIIDGVVTQVPASHTKTVSKSFESKAREAADAIMKSRKDQYNLVAGEHETPYSGDALQIMLAELKNWENNYMSLFTGVSIADTMVYVFYVTPEELSRTNAFYFSESKGFNPNTGAVGDLYSLNFDCFYSQVFKTTTYQYPLNGYMARSQKPVGVSLERGQVKVHDFGIVNMYQAGSPEIITATDKQPLDLGKIGIVF